MKAKHHPSGEPIDAEFDLGFEGESVHVTVHARGGSAASGAQTNPGYEALMQLLLERLRSSRSVLEEVRLASKTVATLPSNERRIQISEYTLPLELEAVADLSQLRYAIRRAVATSHTTATKPRHGNSTKRIELVASCPMPASDMAAILEWGTLHDLDDDLLPADPAQSQSYKEGARVLRKHLARERSRTLVSKAKEAFKENHGRLFCEVCGFDFSETYGALGQDFIEAHHESALGAQDDEIETKIEDLRMVCANCHRMLHRGRTTDVITIEGLKMHLALSDSKNANGRN